MIGIYGGTFDPVHYGHLRPVLELTQDLGLDQVRWIPCGLPAHRPTASATGEQRLQMLEAALQGIDCFTIDRRELDRDGPSYMVDTLLSLQQDFADETLVLIMGADAFAGLSTWHRWTEIFDLAHVLVCQRPQVQWPQTGELKALLDQRCVDDFARLQSQQAGLIYMHSVTQLEISASAIRAQCLAGKRIDFLTSPVIVDYILENGLYK